MIPDDEPSNAWVCPSDRQLSLRAIIKSGWSVWSTGARSATVPKALPVECSITDAEQEQIAAVLARQEESKRRERERIGKLVERLEDLGHRAIGDGISNCRICRTTFTLLGTERRFAAMCAQCQYYVCDGNCGRDTTDGNNSRLFLCSFCAEKRELARKSGKWFYQKMPEYVIPDARQKLSRLMEPTDGFRPATPFGPTSSYCASGTSNGAARGSLDFSNCQQGATLTVTVGEEDRPTTPRRPVTPLPSWTRERGLDEEEVDESFSSEDEFVQSGVYKPPPSKKDADLEQFECTKSRMQDSDSSTDCEPRSLLTTPRTSIATPSSCASRQSLAISVPHSIDSGVVQSDNSLQQGCTVPAAFLIPYSCSSSSNTLLAQSKNDLNPLLDGSQQSMDYSNSFVQKRASADLNTRMTDLDSTPLTERDPPHSCLEAVASSNKAIIELSKASEDDIIPPTSFMSSPEDDSSSLGSIQFTVTYSSELKQLAVHLRDHPRENKLKAMDSNGFSDPYVKLHLIPGNEKATKLTSRTIYKTLNPEWNETLVYHGITADDKMSRSLKITVLDRDRIGHDFIGETRVALKKLVDNETKKFNLYLEHAIPSAKEKADRRERGKLQVALVYNVQQGALLVTILRGAELFPMDSDGFSDPYCKVSLTPLTSKNHKQHTSIKKHTLNPEFNETLKLIVPYKDLKKKTLKVSVFDHDVATSDDFIGGIILSSSAEGERGRHWIECIENSGKNVERWHKLELGR